MGGNNAVKNPTPGSAVRNKRPLRSAAQNSQTQAVAQKSKVTKSKPKPDKNDKSVAEKKAVEPVAPSTENVEQDDSDTPIDDPAQTPKTV